MNSSTESKSSTNHPAVKVVTDLLRELAEAYAEIEGAEADLIKASCQEWVDRCNDPEAIKEVDWGELGGFALDIIRREMDVVTTRVDDFRQMIWVVLQGLREAFQDDQSVNVAVAEQLNRLNDAAGSATIDDLRREVVASVVMINRAIDERKKRQHAQLEELGHQLNRMRSELVKAQKELELDSMTRLYNRASFDQLLGKTIELSVFSGQAACLLMVDIDFFKKINDIKGHVVGDRVILKLAEVLSRTFPRKGDFVARYGGDEFAVILQETALADGEMLAKRLLAELKADQPADDQGVVVATSLSVGVGAMRSGDNVEAWVARADQALYQAKRAGRGCVWASST